MKSNAAPWFNIEPPQHKWLIDGLIPSSGYTALIGKPKSGKSTFLRALIAAIIKNKKFLGRSVEVPAGEGVVLYIHIDPKDMDWQVTDELRDTLHITPEESLRIHLRTPDTAPILVQGNWTQRLDWLKEQVLGVKPVLIVIDLLWQFASVKNANDYKEVLDAINKLQQALKSIHYDNALLVTMHGRKATNPNDEADDIIGSTAQRGSFGTGIFFTRDRGANRYTIFSDQTMRDPLYGEIEKRILIRHSDGTLELGPLIHDLEKVEKQTKAEDDLRGLLDYIAKHPDCEMYEIMGALSMSKKYILALIRRAGDMVRTKGKGVKGDPLLYYAYGMDDGRTVDAQAADIVMSDAATLVERLEGRRE